MSKKELVGIITKRNPADISHYLLAKVNSTCVKTYEDVAYMVRDINNGNWAKGTGFYYEDKEDPAINLFIEGMGEGEYGMYRNNTLVEVFSMERMNYSHALGATLDLLGTLAKAPKYLYEGNKKNLPERYAIYAKDFT